MHLNPIFDNYFVIIILKKIKNNLDKMKAIFELILIITFLEASLVMGKLLTVDGNFEE